MKDWIPKTSKWKAAIDEELDVSLKGEENILYLGASSGTTVEQVSQRTKGIIFAVEKAYQMTIPLIRLAEKKENIIPIYADARNIDFLKEKIKKEKINILFQDIPSLDQVDILKKASTLVDKDCRIYFVLKSQSISQSKKWGTFEKVRDELKNDFKIIDVKSIHKFHKKHWFFILKKKN
jgi:fibrillarin-like pre-rRNA processing protein